MAGNSGDSKRQLDPALVSVAPRILRILMSAGQAILSGGGGGFTRRYVNFVLELQGETSVVYYETDYTTGEPINVQSAPLLLHNRTAQFEELIQTAQNIDFFNIKLDPPASSIVRHTAVAHPEHGVHVVVWSMVASPEPPMTLVRFDLEIRIFLAIGFHKEYGP